MTKTEVKILYILCLALTIFDGIVLLIAGEMNRFQIGLVFFELIVWMIIAMRKDLKK